MLLYHQTSLAKTFIRMEAKHFDNYTVIIVSGNITCNIGTDDDVCIVVEMFGFHSNKVLASDIW